MHSLVKYSNIFCGTDEQVVMLCAGAGLLVFTFSFLVLCIWVGLKAPTLSVQGHAAATFLFVGFRPDMAWFGVVMLARGLLLSLPSVVAPDTPNVQLVLMHSVILVSLVLQGYCQPWKSIGLNWLDTIAQSLFLTLLGVGLGGLEHSESEVDVLHLLGALICIALLVALGTAIGALTLAVAMEKIWDYNALARKITSFGGDPDSALLVSLLQNVAGSVQKSSSQRVSLVAAMDQLGTHDARMILIALTILELELGLSAPSECLADPAKHAALVKDSSPAQRISAYLRRPQSAIAKRRASWRLAAERSIAQAVPIPMEEAQDTERPVSEDNVIGLSEEREPPAMDVPPDVPNLQVQSLETWLERNAGQELPDTETLIRAQM